MLAMKSTINKLKNSEIEIEAELTAELFESFRKKAVLHLSDHADIPGFRKGKVPEDIIVKTMGEMTVLEEMAELAIKDAYPKIIAEHKIDPIGRPEVSITKIAKGNPLSFKLKTAVFPEVKLPDYKSIAKKEMAKSAVVSVEEKEIEDTIKEIQKARAPKMETKEGEKETEPELPELTDEFVKTLGKFENVADFREKLKENIKLEKEQTEREKIRIAILDAIAEKTEVEIPVILIEEEQRKMLARLQYDIEKLGLKFDEYLKNVKKTEDDIKKEWSKDAEKRVKIELVMAEIARSEKIQVPKEELSKELEHLLEHNIGADRERAEIYLEGIMSNQKVIEFLESQKE
jgi:FKBP-type peptidyl-prolyl cis-trans isomerase (trigger factor)